jgi:hypothetical protein
MATSTARLGLRKPASSDTVNVATDIDAAMDTLDSVVGFTTCTSTTRPSTPFLGQQIRETDTSAYYVSNGTAPASGSWVPMVSTEGPTTVGPVGAAAPLRMQTFSTPTGNRLIDSRGSGNTAPSYVLDFDGHMQWGPGGSAATDTELFRASNGGLAMRGGALISSTVGGQRVINAQAAVAATETVVVSTGSLSLDGQSTYKITYYMLGTAGGTGADFDLRIRETNLAGANVKEQVMPQTQLAYPLGMAIHHVYVTTVAETKGWVGTLQRVGGTVTMAPSPGSFIQVEKIGTSSIFSTV